MGKNLYIDASHPDETRIVLKSENYIEEYEYENKNKLNLKNNIYLGKISRIEPSLQAAFVNYGRQRFGFLAFNDIQSDYYQIPHDDKEKLKKEEENLRIELKEKNKHVEEVNKSGEGNADLISANENINEKDFAKDKTKNIKNGTTYDEDGKVLSDNPGYINYTIGQRKGIGLSNKDPLYVKKIDPKNNSITVSGKKSLFSDSCYVSNVNWLTKKTKLPLI